MQFKGYQGHACSYILIPIQEAILLARDLVDPDSPVSII
jgi:hypothetical protein